MSEGVRGSDEAKGNGLLSCTTDSSLATSVKYSSADTSATPRLIFQTVGLRGGLPPACREKPCREKPAGSELSHMAKRVKAQTLTPWTPPSGIPSMRMLNRSCRWLASISSLEVLLRKDCLRDEGLLGWARR